MNKEFELTQVESLTIENLSLRQEIILRELRGLEIRMGATITEIKARLELPEDTEIVPTQDFKKVVLRQPLNKIEGGKK